MSVMIKRTATFVRMSSNSGADLEPDLGNVAEWSRLAATHHAAGAYRDALMNMRLVGEAACRLIIRMAWAGSRATQAIQGASYDDLLRTIQGRALAPPDIVSALHVLRTRGNMAAHGRAVGRTESTGALFMLHAMLAHIHGGLLQQPVPRPTREAMDRAISGQSGPDKDEVLRQVLQEEQQRDRDAAETHAANIGAEDLSRIEREQAADRARIHDLETLIGQLSVAKPVAAPPPPPAEAPVEVPVPSSAVAHRWRRPAILSIAFILLLAVVSLFLFRHDHQTSPVHVAAARMDPGHTSVLILPFTVLQDDPALTFRFEEALQNRLRDRIKQGGLAMRVQVADTVIHSTLSEDSAVAIGHRHGADLVFFGELYEPTATDSGRIMIRFAATAGSRWPMGDLGQRAFRTLADSAAIRTQLGVQTIAELCLADRMMRAGAWSKALTVLYATPIITQQGSLSVHLLRARSHYHAHDMVAAMREMKAALALEPDNAQVNAEMARVMDGNGDLSAAIGFYEKALAMQPKEVDWLMSLVRIVGDRSQPATFDMPKTRALVRRALEADSTRSDAWDVQGKIYMGDRLYADARMAFERAYALDSTDVQIQHDLAEVLAAYTRPPEYERAEMLLRRVVRADSSRSHAVLLLAQILTSGPHRDPVLADRLFRKSREKAPQWEYASWMGRGKAAVERGVPKEALENYTAAWSLDSGDVSLGITIAKLHSDLGEKDAARSMLLRCYAVDSMDHLVNLNLGRMYLHTGADAREDQLALMHLERALLTDPYDQMNLSELGIGQFNADNPGRAGEVFNKLLVRDPANGVAHRYLGVMAQQRGDVGTARMHYEKALAADPYDEVACGNLATLLLTLRPPQAADALMLLKRALERSPNDAATHMNMASALIELGEYSAAAEHYRRVLELKPAMRQPSIESQLRANGYW